ncbi:MAG: tRNA uridine-5-carboxymethylaminomethyl(34) synthesis GTPase MnmE [Treponema sp.]|jgi:tRNA modification GTPase|nr:tRNA uridine-5-carboxymethylaminomethyl(34) synthesis GTPase MnmE [Treponema sp.]
MGAPSYGDQNPIAAPATALSESALAVIRTSGEGAVDRVAAVFSRPRRLRQAPGNSILHGWIQDPGGQRIDEVLLSVYRAPKSYTGEEGVDISCHGGISTVRAVMEALRGAGFRDSLPGEFTFRAFMNGKMVLTRAESVMELVSARTEPGRRRAVGRLSGALEGEIREIKTLLVEVLAGTELFLDYSEDDGVELSAGDEAAGRLPHRRLAEEVLGRLRVLADSYRMEKLYREGALVVIAGRPNAGKSSLFNRLLKEDRSIVTDIPGTTRDWIEAWISLEGIPLRLADTAGLRAPEDPPAPPAEDPIEQMGMERSRELLRAADLVLYLIDGTGGFTEEDAAFFRDYSPPRVLSLWNKTDAAPLPEGTPPGGVPPEKALPPGILGISAKTGRGIPELAEAAAGALRTLYGGPGTEAAGSPGIGTGRQRECIVRALESLEEALDMAEREEPLDLIAPLLREGVRALGEITGEVSTAEILDTLFSRFCVGK